MAISLSAVTLVLCLTPTAFGIGWLIHPPYKNCDPCQDHVCADPTMPYCRAVGTAGTAAAPTCFSIDDIKQSSATYYPICAPGAGDPVAMASGAALTCSTDTDCPTNFVCTRIYRHRRTKVCCNDPSNCDKFGTCPTRPYCRWRCTSDSDCSSYRKCCGPYTGISRCDSSTMYCESVLYTFSGK